MFGEFAKHGAHLLLAKLKMAESQFPCYDYSLGTGTGAKL